MLASHRSISYNFIPDTLASILGSQDVYVKKGSTISLTCSVNVHSAPSSIQWYHGTLPVDFDSKRGGISLETEKTETGLTSKLLITKAALSDSGNYTCVPSNSSPASVSVHVLIGNILAHIDNQYPKYTYLHIYFCQSKLIVQTFINTVIP